MKRNTHDHSACERRRSRRREWKAATQSHRNWSHTRLQQCLRSAVRKKEAVPFFFVAPLLHFCAGDDVAGFAGGGRRRDQAGLEALLDSLENVPDSLRAAVQASALWWRFELALNCGHDCRRRKPRLSVWPRPRWGSCAARRVQSVPKGSECPAKEMAMFLRRHDQVDVSAGGAINGHGESEIDGGPLSWARQLAAGTTVALRGHQDAVRTGCAPWHRRGGAQQTEVNKHDVGKRG